MKLYELTGLFAELFEQFDEIANFTPDTDEYGRMITEDGDIIADLDDYRERLMTAWFDTLTGIEGEFDEKAENLAVAVKNLSAEVEAMKAEEKKLRERRVNAERQVERMKVYLMKSMQAIGRTKIDMPRARISLCKNPVSVAIENEKALIDWAQLNDETILRYKEPELKKNDIKALLGLHVEIPFCHLERKDGVRIK